MRTIWGSGAFSYATAEFLRLYLNICGCQQRCQILWARQGASLLLVFVLRLGAVLFAGYLIVVRYSGRKRMREYP